MTTANAPPMNTGIPDMPIFQHQSDTGVVNRQQPRPAPAPAGEPQKAARDAAHQVTQDTLAALTAQSRHYPAVPEANAKTGAAAYSTRWLPPTELGADDARIVDALHRFITARTMDEHNKAVANFARDATWDTVPLLVHGRDDVRVTAYALKTLASLDFEVLAVKSEVLDPVMRRLQLELRAHVRPWLAQVWPLSLALPQDIPIHVTVMVGRRVPANEPPGSFGLITWIQSRLHNLPALPTPLRALLGQLVGRGLSLSEGLWQQALPLLGDHSLQWQQKWNASSAGTQRMY